MPALITLIHDRLLHWLSWLVYTQIVLLALLFFFLLLHKVHVERQARCREGLKKQIFQEICRHLICAEGELKRPACTDEYAVFAECCIDLMLSITGDEAGKVRDLLRNYGVAAHYCRMATSTNWLHRFQAVERLGLFALEELSDFFQDAIRRERVTAVRMRMIWGLSRIAGSESFVALTDLLASEPPISGKFNESVFGNMIDALTRKGEADRLKKLVDEALRREDMPLPLRKDLVEACGSARFASGLDSIIATFHRHRSVPEMRIVCIRAAGRLAGAKPGSDAAGTLPPSLLTDLLLPGLADPDWRVRSAAARSAPACGRQAIPPLVKLLYDEVYFVRINAGNALADLGPEGLSALKAEAASTDRFVRDTVQYVLGEAVSGGG
jgi:hypothetical protein